MKAEYTPDRATPRHRGLAALAVISGIGIAAVLGCGSSKESGPSTSATSTQLPTFAPTGTLAPTGTSAPTATATTTATLDPDDEARESLSLPGGPERRTLTAVADEPGLEKNRDFVADHYGVVKLPFPLQLQSMKLTEGRRALLFTGQGPALDKPLVLVVSAKNELLWSKPRPLAGTHEQAKELQISRGPHGMVYLFLYDEPSRVLAGRAWTSEGGIFADFQVLTAEGCDATTVYYQPGLGWVTALLEDGKLHAQILGENGTLKWPGNGIEVQPPKGAAPLPKDTRPKVEVAATGAVEITLGARKIRISPEGALLK